MTTQLAALGPDFQRRSRSKLSELLILQTLAAAASPVAPSEAAVSFSETPPAEAEAGGASPRADEEEAASSQPPAQEPAPRHAPPVPVTVAAIEDKLVRLEPRGRRGTLLKDPPVGGLGGLAGAEDLELYGLEALKKLARVENLEVAKGSNRDAVLQALREGLAAAGR